MLKKILVGILILFSFNFAFAASQDDANKQLQNTLVQMKEAWNKGDIDAVMSAYKNSDSTLYLSSQVIHGYQNIKKRYLTNYPTRQDMGTVSFGNIDIKLLSPRYAMVIGQWHLTRPAKNDIGGVFSLLYENTKEGWKIIVDHSS